MNTRLLSRRDVADLLDLGPCRVAVEEAFRQHGAGEAPPPQVLAVPVEGGGFHVKAGTLRGVRRYFAAKVNGNFSGNERLGLPRIQGVIVLCDAEDGSVLVVMDSSEITKLRTAAATAVAAAQLARAGSKTVTIVGCGVQGRAQLRALAPVLPLERAFAFDENRERTETFVGDFSMKGEEGGRGGRLVVLAAESLCEALAASDVVVACTPSRKPYLFGPFVKAGTFVAAVGADAEDKQELDVGLLASAKVVTDVTAQCAAFGDLHHAIRAGVISASDVYAELGEIVAGKKPGRTSEDEVIVFDSTGMALQDVAAAAAAFERAEALGIGIPAPLSS